MANITSDGSLRTLILITILTKIYNEVQHSLSQALLVLNANRAAKAFASLLGETLSYLRPSGGGGTLTCLKVRGRVIISGYLFSEKCRIIGISF